MSSGVDYSKWDKLDYGSSDDEGSGSDQGQAESDVRGQQPRVTRFDQPSTITRNVDGELIVETQHDAGEMVALTESLKYPKESTGTGRADSAFADENPTDSALASSLSNDTATIPKTWTEKGSFEIVQGCEVYWSQDRYSVMIRIALPEEGKWTCVVSSLLAYADRFVAVGSGPKSLLEVWRADLTNSVLMRSEIAYPVHATEDDEGVDWSIERIGVQRFLSVTLNKATPMAGMTLWWKRPLSEMKEISMDWREPSSTSFQKVWNEAHAQFYDKHRN
ncbi:hypothetical protein MPSEU_000538800 [Mayamaea pseudoterrestris]|nr:hypothetical protein MPSEU_000538800 [Mayamaea pseudoterrestris]